MVETRKNIGRHLISQPLVKRSRYVVERAHFKPDFSDVSQAKFFFQELNKAGGYAAFAMPGKNTEGKYPAHGRAIFLFCSTDDIANDFPRWLCRLKNSGFGVD